MFRRSVILRSVVVCALVGSAPLVVHAGPAIQISNRPAVADEVGYLPRQGSTVNVNPPPLAWVNEKGATTWTIQISPATDFMQPLIQVEGWPYLLYTHTEPLAPGRYYWRYSAAGKGRTRSPWSVVRSFDVPSTATKFPRPSARQLKQVVPVAHPRMFVRPEKLPDLRATTSSHAAEYAELLKTADAYLSAPLMAQPAPWTDGKWNAAEWGQGLREASRSTNQMNQLAFAWLISGHQEYGLRAREHLMNYAQWEPLGTSSMQVNDEVGMPVLYSMARTYDWLYPILSAEDRQKVLSNISARGRETYNRLRKTPYEQFADNSHFGRMWHFLGEAGLATYGEIPEAETWLNYSMTIFYGWYPYWGRADGGWAEGIHYWTSYNTMVTWWLDLMQESLGLQGTDKPFYANVGDFPMYVCPPGSPIAGFGDFSEKPVAATSIGTPMAAYASFRIRPDWKWYAETLGVENGSGFLGYIRSLRKEVASHPPENTSLLKLFPEIGYAAFNTSLTSASSNLAVTMRSSPFGNVSHSHNDQNSIVMAAFGEPLLVNTGTRDFYGSPFCKEYYWTTLSHNSILLDGKGQPRSQEAAGKFISSGSDGNRMAWVVGDASSAYSSLASLYRRWVIMLPANDVIIVDELQTTASQLSLLFHGRAEFRTSETVNTFSLKKGEVTLSGRIAFQSQDNSIVFEQTDKYPVPLGNNRTPLFDEWHLKAQVPLSGNGSSPQRVVTFLHASKDETGSPNWEVSPSESTADILSMTSGQNGRRVRLEINFSSLTVKRSE